MLINRWTQSPLVAAVIFFTGWTVPARTNILLESDVKAAFGALPFGDYQNCDKQVLLGAGLVTVNCGSVPEVGTEPGNPPLGYVTTLSASATAYSAFGGQLGVRPMASVISDHSGAYLGVGATADALVEDQVHPFSALVPVGGLLDLRVNVLVDGESNSSINGPVISTILSNLGFSLNTGTLSVPNFANTPGPVEYSFDAGIVPNGGVADFTALMDTQVSLSPVNSASGVSAILDLDYFDTAQITSITATYNGQPVTDLTVTGDSGATYPTTVVPEPGMLVPLVLGSVCLLWRRRRMRAQRLASSRLSQASA
jgi:hypothetical protein